MTKFVTDAGKEIDFVIDPKTVKVRIQFTSGGQLPDILTGQYTTFREAEKAVRMYLATKNSTSEPTTKSKRTTSTGKE